MLSSTGRAPRGGSDSLPPAACRAKSPTEAMAARSETAQMGGRLASTTLLTGQVSPQASTTVISARRPWRRELSDTGTGHTQPQTPVHAILQRPGPAAQLAISGPLSVGDAGGGGDLHEEIRGVQHHLHRRPGRLVVGEVAP